MTLEQLGWRGPREDLVASGESLGRVAVEHRDGFLLYTEAGEIPATLAGRLRHEADAVWPAVGDWVALHWDWMCDRITERQARLLKAYTDRHLTIVNTAGQPAAMLG